MAINIQSKTDYSYLFSSLGSSNGSSSANLNFLSDYASIKNGSYLKLMKAYYSETGKAGEIVNNSKRSTSTSADSADTLTSIQKSTDELKESADALLAKGNKSVFKEQDGAINTDEVYKAVNDFVKDYNSVVSSTEDSNTKSIASRSMSMINTTASYEKQLSQIGITINDDFTLSLDEDTFKKADMSDVKNLFNDTGSYAYKTSAQSSLINFSADTEASKANTYNYNGTYNNAYNTGNLFNTYW